LPIPKRCITNKEDNLIKTVKKIFGKAQAYENAKELLLKKNKNKFVFLYLKRSVV
jgi:hypothetical protein